MNSYYRKQRALEKAQLGKLLDLYHAEHEGRFCVCGHSPAFHWNYQPGREDSLGRCADADCGCKAYDENVFAGMEARDTRQKQRAEDDKDGLARAVRQAENAPSDAESWEQAVADAEKPTRVGKRRGQPPKHDPGMLDALRALGGNPEDLSH
jgi:hypothetical protein